jgi:uncharacterized membrane protein YeaQ/YmgE (transglycosylase-associated protein family)
MSYLFVVVIGALVGLIAGKYIKGSELGSGVDAAIGAAGGCLAVVLSRIVGSVAAAGYLISVIVAVSGAFIALYGTRRYMRAKAVPVPRARRR